MILLGIVLATAAALAYAVAAQVQHAAVHAFADPHRARHAMLPASWVRMRMLVRDRGWRVGLVALSIGTALHAVALACAPLTVVQPLGVLAIGFTVLLSRTAPSRRTVLAALTSGLGIAVFVLLVAQRASDAVAIPRATGQRVMAIAGIAITGLVVSALARRGWTRSLAFAAATGVAYAAVSALTRIVASHIRASGVADLPPLPLLGIVLCLAVGAACLQQAYASGGVDTVQATQTVVDPLVGVLIGMFVLHEGRPGGAAIAFGEAAGAALAVIGVVALARRPSPTSPASTGHTPAGPPDRPVGQGRVRRPGEQPVPHLDGRCLPAVRAGRRLRIVIGADTFPPDINGAARFAHRLATGLAGRGHDVHVLCPSDTGRDRVEDVDAVTLHRLAAHRTPMHPSFRVCLPWRAHTGARNLLGALRPDLVHVQAHFMVGRSLVRHAGALGIPVIATNHFMPENLFGHLRVPHWLRGRAREWAWRDLASVLRPACVITAPTPTAVRLLAQYGVSSHAVALSCGVSLPSDHARSSRDDQPDARPTVLFVGRLDEEKHVDVLLRAVALVPELASDVIGDGPLRVSLTRLAGRLGILGRVRFHGFVSEAALARAYARCTVFCMPGTAELQSLATMEAMAAGKPVIAADAVALPHLVRPGRNGWLFPPGEVSALAEVLATACARRDELATMGAASRQLIAAHDINTTLTTFESLYRSVLDPHPPACAALSPAELARMDSNSTSPE